VENENRLVLLDDIHERSTEVPDVNPKNGQTRGFKRERNTYQTEIYLTPADSERFVKLLNIVDL
jgi:hypothetical protein